MNEVQNEGQQDPTEKLVEDEALKSVTDDDIRSGIIEKYGLDEYDNADLIDRLVSDKKDEHKKLSTAIAQKIKYREAVKAPKEQKPEETPQPTPQKDFQVSDEMIDKKVTEKLEERELDSMELSDSLKAEVRAYAKVKGLSIRQAEKSDYISFLKEKESDKVREEEASASSKTKSSKKAKRDFGSYTDKDITDLSGEEFQEYQKWLKAQ